MQTQKGGGILCAKLELLLLFKDLDSVKPGC